MRGSSIAARSGLCSLIISLKEGLNLGHLAPWQFQVIIDINNQRKEIRNCI
ncbi:hypothetical protein Scep_014759 [Stephania cephalantha]|uniref:Uncharacterized protein n=1 Tax=Stephania cephalantha TaxID=152367 RepID=A0AAP0J3S4_9MAGN